MLAEAGLVVEEGICEMEIAVKLMVIELHGHCVVRILVDSPDKPDQVQTQVLSVPTPGSCARLERLVKPRLEDIGSLIWIIAEDVIVVSRSLAAKSVSGAVVINDEVVVVFPETIIKQRVQIVGQLCPSCFWAGLLAVHLWFSAVGCCFVQRVMNEWCRLP